jgi:urea transporter
VTGVASIPAEMWFTALTKRITEVRFADSIVVGILFLIGIVIVSLRRAAIALGGALVGVVVPTLLGANQSLIEMGLYGVQSGSDDDGYWTGFFQTLWEKCSAGVAGGYCCRRVPGGLANFLAPLGLPTLTFPFVLVMWMFLFASGKSRYWAAPLPRRRAALALNAIGRSLYVC